MILCFTAPLTLTPLCWKKIDVLLNFIPVKISQLKIFSNIQKQQLSFYRKGGKKQQKNEHIFVSFSKVINEGIVKVTYCEEKQTLERVDIFTIPSSLFQKRRLKSQPARFYKVQDLN